MSIEFEVLGARHNDFRDVLLPIHSCSLGDSILSCLRICPKDFTLVARAQRYSVDGAIVSTFSGDVSMHRLAHPNSTTFKIRARIADAIMPLFLSLLDGEQVTVTEQAFTELRRLAAALQFRPNTFPAPPGDHSMRLNAIHKFPCTLVMSSETLRQSLPLLRTLQVNTRSRQYHVPFLTASLSPVLRSHFDSGVFVYDFEDTDGVFDLVCQYLMGSKIHFLAGKITSLLRIASDLELSDLLQKVSFCIERHDRIQRVLANHVDLIEAVTELHADFSQLTEQNHACIADKLLQSDWFGSPGRIQEFVHILFINAQAKPGKAGPLASLLFVVSQSPHGEFVSDFVRKQVVQHLNACDLLPLAVALNERGLIPTADIVDEIWVMIVRQLVDARSRHGAADEWVFRDRPSLAFSWFLPEMVELRPVLVHLSYGMDETLQWFWSDKLDRQLTGAEVLALKADDWRMFRELRRSGRNFGRIYTAICEDNIEDFVACFAGQQLDFNLRLPRPCFSIRDEANESTMSVLAWAARAGSISLVKHLLINGATVSADEMARAIEGDCTEVIRLFDDHAGGFAHSPAELSFNFPTCLEMISYKGDPSIYAWIEYALSFCQTGVFRWLLESKVKDLDNFALHFASLVPVIFASCNFEALRMLLEMGGDLAPAELSFVELADLGCESMLRFVNEIAHDQLLPHASGPFARSHVYSLLSFRDIVIYSGSLSMFEFVWGLCERPPGSAICVSIGAAFDGDYGDIAVFLISQVTPAELQLYIRAVLAYGAYRGTPQIAQLLLPFMTELTDITEYIEIAAEARNIALAKFWIDWQRRADPRGSFRAVWLAAIRGADLEIPRFLVTPEADLLGEMVKTAIDKGFFDGLQYALGFLSRSERREMIARHSDRAIQSRVPEIANLFMAESFGSREAFVQAVRLGDIEFVKRALSLSRSADAVNFVTQDGTPLGIAAAGSNVDMINLLLSVPGIDPMMPDCDGNSPFVLACRHASTSDIWRLFVTFCGDDYHVINTGFFCAIQLRGVDLEFDLWPFFSQFHVLNPNFHCGATSAFIRAAAVESSDILSILLNFPDLNVNDRDDTGTTALIAAVEFGDIERVRLLVNDPRVDVNIVNFAGWSALSMAALSSRADIVGLLLACGRLDFRDSGGRALSVAIVKDAAAIATMLLARPDIDVNEDWPFRHMLSTGLPPLPGLQRPPGSTLPELTNTALLSAVQRDDLGRLAQIIAHARFDPVRSNVTFGLFHALQWRRWPVFQVLHGAGHAIRSSTGEFLLAAAVATCIPEFVEPIWRWYGGHVTWDVRVQLLRAAAAPLLGEIADFLATTLRVDVNAPLPTHFNLFPDRVVKRTVHLLTVPFERFPDRVKGGSPILFSLAGIDEFQHAPALRSDRIDVNQRGHHGQTILFEMRKADSFVRKLVERERLDLKATDRHRNGAVTCAVLSRDEWAIYTLLYFGCETRVRNENGDTAWELRNHQIRRNYPSVSGFDTKEWLSLLANGLTERTPARPTE